MKFIKLIQFVFKNYISIRNDANYIKYWEKEKEKGILKFLVRNCSISISIMFMFGIFASIKKYSFLGFEKNLTIIISLIDGAVIGTILSIFLWIQGNNRYSQISKKDKYIH